jgi:hypothetical protein
LSITTGPSASRSTFTSPVRSPLVKFMFSMCHPHISSWMSWLRACLLNYLLILVQSMRPWTSLYDCGGRRVRTVIVSKSYAYIYESYCSLIGVRCFAISLHCANCDNLFFT